MPYCVARRAVVPPSMLGTELLTFGRHCNTGCCRLELECAMHCLHTLVTKHTCCGAAWGDAVVWAIVASCRH